MTEAEPSPENPSGRRPEGDGPLRAGPVRAPMSRRWLVLLGVLIALVLVEAGLQVAAYTMYLRGDGEPRPTSSGGVLCIGDSFTFGLGASDPAHSYPAQLTELLAARGFDLTISNLGWPGQNSRDVLTKLARPLDERRPRLVYLLVGTNDRWSRPSRLEAGAEQHSGREGFVWRWRTWRLVQLLTQRSGERTVAERGATAPFVGSWQIGRYGVTFEDSGRLIVGGTPLHWSEDAQGIHVRTAADNAFTMSWSLHGDVLRLESPLWPGPVEMKRGLPVGDLEVARARKLVEDGDCEGATRVLRAAIDAGPPAPVATEILVGCLDRAGLTDESAAEVARLRRSFDETADGTVGEVLLRIYVGAGEPDVATAISMKVAGVAPGSAELVRFVLNSPPDRQESALSVARTAALAARAAGSNSLQALWSRAEADLLRASDPEASLRAVVIAFAADGDELATLHYLRRAGKGLDEEAMRAITLKCAVATPARDQVLQWIAGLSAPAVDQEDVLRDHLARAVRLARQYTARIVLLSYPQGEAVHARIAASVAKDQGCGWLDVRPRFEEALRAHAVEQLFIPDGHCTDQGYAILAAAVADDVAARRKEME